MLTFRAFAANGLGCVIHAETGNEPVCFDISSLILTESLGGGNPVHREDNVKLCEEKREIIEAACRRAYGERPADNIELQKRDFTRA